MKTFCRYIKIFCLVILLASVSSCAPLSSQQNESDRPSSEEELTKEREQILRQIEETLHRAEVHVRTGQLRWRESSFLEAQYEFEQAYLLLVHNINPRLDYLEQTKVLGGIGILSQSTQVSGIRVRRKELERAIKDAEQLKIMERGLEEEKIANLRRQNRAALQPINPPISYYGSKSSYDLFFAQPGFRQFGPFDTKRWRSVENDIERNIEILLRQGEAFRQCLFRADSYFPRVTSILAAEGVPEVLAYVALLESGYQPEAKSSSGKAGLWQLSPSIARQYGLHVSASYDERFEVHASTCAFARYMSQLYRQYGNWVQAIAAFSPERDYLARFIAANRIANNPRQYGLYMDLHNMTGRYDLLREGGRRQRLSDPDFWGPPAY